MLWLLHASMPLHPSQRHPPNQHDLDFRASQTWLMKGRAIDLQRWCRSHLDSSGSHSTTRVPQKPQGLTQGGSMARIYLHLLDINYVGKHKINGSYWKFTCFSQKKWRFGVHFEVILPKKIQGVQYHYTGWRFLTTVNTGIFHQKI